VDRPLSEALAVRVRQLQQDGAQRLAAQLEQRDHRVPDDRVVVVVERRLDGRRVLAPADPVERDDGGLSADPRVGVVTRCDRGFAGALAAEFAERLDCELAHVGVVVREAVFDQRVEGGLGGSALAERQRGPPALDGIAVDEVRDLLGGVGPAERRGVGRL